MLIRLILIVTFMTTLTYAQKPKVVTSFSILADITQNIGKDKITLTSIIQPQQNAHTYEPTPTDIKQLSDADLFIINGLMFEGWLTRAVDASGFKGTLVNVSDNIVAIKDSEDSEDQEHEHEHEHEHKHNHDHDHADHHHDIDPHIWQSPLNGIIIAESITAALSEKDPENAAFYEQNLATYRLELTALDAWISAELETIPAQNRNVLVLHDSFQYFAARYPIHYFPILGKSLLSEPSAKAIAELKTRISQNQITTVFSDTIAHDRFVTILVRDYQLKHGGILISDALNTQGKPGDSYIGLFKENVARLIEALK